MGRCKTALDEKRYNWRHDSILAVPSNFIKIAKNIKIHYNIEGYMNPTNQSVIFVIELTVGFQTNIDLNTKRKANNYKEMLKSLKNKFENFINLIIVVLGIVGVHSNVTNMLKALGFQQQEIAYLIKKIMCCCIRGTYYVFCMRNKAWSQPSLLSWWRPTCHPVRPGNHALFMWVVSLKDF